MPNIRHDYPGGWQPERSQSQRVLELLPLDTGEARVWGMTGGVCGLPWSAGHDWIFVNYGSLACGTNTYKLTHTHTQASGLGSKPMRRLGMFVMCCNKLPNQTKPNWRRSNGGIFNCRRGGVDRSEGRRVAESQSRRVGVSVMHLTCFISFRSIWFSCFPPLPYFSRCLNMFFTYSVVDILRDWRQPRGVNKWNEICVTL